MECNNKTLTKHHKVFNFKIQIFIQHLILLSQFNLDRHKYICGINKIKYMKIMYMFLKYYYKLDFVNQENIGILN